MKILYLKLKNFATIYTAMNRKEIEIDFTKSKNKVVLLIGGNGSGKTSILSSLHPYAYLGSLDVRNNADIIREGHDGYKEIHYQKGNDIYVIKHNYLFSKKNQQLKSFISKNGVELNPNGNVGSFNETVLNELSLKQDFLRLIRLGSNVNNLIDMKSTERKTFTSNLLSDMDIYNDLFKKISDDSRMVRSLIKSVSDKITRLNISDVSIIQSEINTLNENLKTQLQLKDSYQHELGSLEGTLSTICPDGIDVVKSRVADNKRNLHDVASRLSNAKTELDKYVIVTSDINEDINTLKTEIMQCQSDKHLCENVIIFFNEQLSKLYDAKDEILNKIKLCKSSEEHYRLLDLKVELMNRISEGDKKFKDYKNPYTKDELLTLLKTLYVMNDVAKTIYSFDIRAVKSVVQMLRDGTNVSLYISDELSKLNTASVAKQIDLRNITSDTLVLFRPEECGVDKCPYMYLYELLFSKDKESKQNEMSIDTQREILSDMSIVLENINHIFMIVRSNSHLIEKGNLEYFSISYILNRLEHGDDLYNEDDITNRISVAEEYEKYISDKDSLKNVLIELKSMSDTKDDVDKLKTELMNIENQISEIGKSIKEKENEINDIVEGIILLHESLTQFVEYDELTKLIVSLEGEHNNLIAVLNTDYEIIADTSAIENRIQTLKSSIQTTNWNIDKLNSDLFTKKVAMQDFEKLTEEKSILVEKFDDIEIIKESLSPTKGIPLLYIQLYLKNTTMFVNNLLQSVYGDEFAIDDFEITPTEFNIPYIKNGVRINDVAYASQGEKSFLSLALSFALINQSIQDYNVLLLDEIDSTLDTKNRAMFLNILEKQMEIIDAEQIFLITHNNMFDSYPVDVILTSNQRIDNYNNANIIFNN